MLLAFKGNLAFSLVSLPCFLKLEHLVRRHSEKFKDFWGPKELVVNDLLAEAFKVPDNAN